MSAERKAELEVIVRNRAKEIRRLTKQNAEDAQELRGYHDTLTWLTFLASTMPTGEDDQ